MKRSLNLISLVLAFSGNAFAHGTPPSAPPNTPNDTPVNSPAHSRQASSDADASSNAPTSSAAAASNASSASISTSIEDAVRVLERLHGLVRAHNNLTASPLCDNPNNTEQRGDRSRGRNTFRTLLRYPPTAVQMSQSSSSASSSPSSVRSSSTPIFSLPPVPSQFSMFDSSSRSTAAFNTAQPAHVHDINRSIGQQQPAVPSDTSDIRPTRRNARTHLRSLRPQQETQKLPAIKPNRRVICKVKHTTRLLQSEDPSFHECIK